LLAGAAVALATGTVYAQTSDQAVETVVVTGSLIQRTAGDMPTPTVVLSSDAIQKTGLPNIGNVLAQLPQVQNSGDLTPLNSNFLTGGFGVWNVDLRGLGSSRTLVLVDGLRQVTGSPTGTSVDLNTIPTALIERIDVITGGASATYGSDAIAGVVNFILKQDFEGIAANYQNGLSARGDGAETYATLTMGGNFANDRGNVTVSLTYDHTGAVMSKDRDITSTDTTWSPGLFQYTGTRVGPYMGYLGIGAAYSSYGLNGRFRLARPVGPGGQVIASGSPSLGFNPDGTSFVTAVNGFDRNPNRYIQVPVSRKVIATTGHYDITNWLTAFVEATYALSHASQQLEPYPGASTDGLSAPTSANGTGILIPVNNPFIDLQGTGAGSLRARLTAVPSAVGLFFYRRFADLGDRTGSVDRDMSKITMGLKGKMGIGDWTWQSYYEWGRTAESQFNGGYYDKTKMQQALTTSVATPAQIAAHVPYVTVLGVNYVCADPIAQAAGCVPLNLFGAGSITSAAAAFIGSQVTIQDEAVEQVANFQATGSLFDLPAGAVKLAVGAEYRRESAYFIPDAASQAGTVAGNSQPATAGAFQVAELFAEGVLPLIKGVPLIDYLELDGALRWAHYSTAGNAMSWNYRLIYRPVPAVTVRAAYSSATRAPNISELYSPAAQTFPGFSATSDPCRGVTVSANCAAHFAALGPALPGEPGRPSYTQAMAQGVGGYVSGNPNLAPEMSHSLTGGIVYTPEWLTGFQATVDYYDIRIAGYIGALGISSTLAACYDASAAPYATNIYCQQITRQHDPVQGPVIQQIDFPTFNLGSIKTNGIDLALNYAFALGDLASGLENAGALAFGVNANYINSYQVDPGTAGSTATGYAGTIGTPHFRGNMKAVYSLDPVTVTLNSRYIGGAMVDRGLRDCIEYDTTDPDICVKFANVLSGNRVRSTWYFDLNVTYAITEAVEVYAGANNLFDNSPPEIYPGGGYDDTGTGTVADVYDPIGQYFYVGVNFKM